LGFSNGRIERTSKYEAAFADDFYDDIVIGVHRMMSVRAILSFPVVFDDEVYFGSTDGNLYAIHKPNNPRKLCRTGVSDPHTLRCPATRNSTSGVRSLPS